MPLLPYLSSGKEGGGGRERERKREKRGGGRIEGLNSTEKPLCMCVGHTHIH